MSLRSLPIQDFGSSEADTEKRSTSGRGARLKMPNKRRDIEGDMAERALALRNSQAGYVGTLKKMKADIQCIIDAGGPLVDLKSK